jgi:HTH-type transcriptional regulator, competence development regulator
MKRTMKLHYPKAWFERSAEIEGDTEVGAGIPPFASASTELHAQDITVLDTRIALGQFVSLWRRNHGWNAETLAAEAGIDIAEVLEIEHDPHCEPEPDAIYKLAEVFRVPPRRLMEVAGLVENRTSTLREHAVRFAARSEPIAALTDIEKEALEAFVAALSEEPTTRP